MHNDTQATPGSSHARQIVITLPRHTDTVRAAREGGR